MRKESPAFPMTVLRAGPPGQTDRVQLAAEARTGVSDLTAMSVVYVLNERGLRP
jgi:hypothetical protein